MPKALLVTDSEWVTNDVLAALSIDDWEVQSIEDPHTVLDSVEETSPEAVIVDMQIANMGGMAVVREIRSSLDESERPRTVLLMDRSADEFLAGRAGADASVLKPFEAAALRNALQ